MKRLLLVSLILSVLALGSGFGLPAYGGDCGCGGPAPAPVVAYDSCDGCGACDACACGRPCHKSCNPLLVPLKVIDWVVHLGCNDCDSGCGERYWGECSEPVDCHDPCDRCGNYVGRTYATPAPGYVKAGYRTPTYAQRAPQTNRTVNAEFGLDSSARVISRSDQVVAPVGASTVARTAQSPQPHRAPARR